MWLEYEWRPSGVGVQYMRSGILSYCLIKLSNMTLWAHIFIYFAGRYKCICAANNIQGKQSKRQMEQYQQLLSPLQIKPCIQNTSLKLQFCHIYCVKKIKHSNCNGTLGTGKLTAIKWIQIIVFLLFGKSLSHCL